MATRSSIRVWKIPWTQEWWALVYSDYTAGNHTGGLHRKRASSKKDNKCLSFLITLKLAVWGLGEGGQSVSSKYMVQFSSVTQSCLTLCDPMNCSTPGLPVHH